MAPVKSVKRRTRSGCLTCRDRHMKCDESLPVCQNCIKSSRKCYRGTRLNFIQYSFYNPNVPLTRGNFHLLDQSITIAGLYNGKRHYNPYMHLHTPEELKYSDDIFKLDCEQSGGMSFDEEKYEVPLNVSNNGTPKLRGPSRTPKIKSDPDTEETQSFEPALEPVEHKQLITNPEHIQINRPIENSLLTEELMNTFQIPESAVNLAPTGNFNIQNFLLKPKYEFEPPNLSSSKIIFDNPNFEFDIKSFTKLLDQEKYYWVLDLFNEFNVWKSIVPSYCLNLIKQEDSSISNTFLINCLLNCCEDSLADHRKFAESLTLQLQYFKTVVVLKLNNECFKFFETLLVSVTLNLLALLNKLVYLNKDSFVNGELKYQDFILIFNNQVKLFNKLIYRFYQLSPAKLKKFKSMVFISCVHSIVILKFVIVKGLEQHDIFPSKNQPFSQQNQQNEWIEDLDEPISYDSQVPQSPIIKWNQFEIDNLNNNFINVEFNQIHNDFYSISNSTSLKLRKLVWAFIKLDYLTIHPESNAFDLSKIGFDVKFNTSMPGKMIVFPNDKLTLLVLMSNHLNRIILTTNHQLNLDKEASLEESVQNIQSIFEVIQNSLIHDHFKSLWSKYFNWVLT